MAEVAELIRRIDTSTSASVNEVRVIQLQHSLASDLGKSYRLRSRERRASKAAACGLDSRAWGALLRAFQALRVLQASRVLRAARPVWQAGSRTSSAPRCSAS